MTIRVSNRSNIDAILANLRKASDGANAELSHLSSGKKIQKAADGAAELSLSTKINSFVKSQQAASRNASEGISFVQTAEGGLTEVSNILVRLRELTIQSASDTVGEAERGFLDKEFQELKSEVDRIAEATSFNGTNVINGEKGVLEFHVGSFAGDENKIEFDTSGNHVDTDELGISSSNVLDKTDALDSIASIDNAIERVSSQRSQMGAIQSRLSNAYNNIQTSIINHQEASSKIEDTDIAYSSAKLASHRLQQNSAIKALSLALSFPKDVTKLIE